METLQLKAENESGDSRDRVVFDGSNVYERCHRCAEIHWIGWPCYHCAIVKRRISKKGFVSPITPPRKYLSSTLARCKHCNLAIWERTRKQTFHPQCKALWDERKRTVFKVNQILWSIRKKGYYVL